MMDQVAWGPSASIDTLLLRAHVMSAIRRFFEVDNVVEVTVPSMGMCAVSDPFIDALNVSAPVHVDFRCVSGVLQTSPEYFLKRLLSAGMPDCYYLGAAFRADEASRKHNPEFTMLEWYRIGWCEQALCEHVFSLIRYVSHAISQRCDVQPLVFEMVSYQSLFERYLDVNPHQASIGDLQKVARAQFDIQFESEVKSVWLDLLFSHVIEPNLQGCVGVYDYPLVQSALAKVSANLKGELVAKRFEVYLNGIELANGYNELTCVSTVKRRYEQDCATRQQEGLPAIAMDEKFLASMQAGMPECAGVALGVDRLMMCLFNKADISSVLPFAYSAL